MVSDDAYFVKAERSRRPEYFVIRMSDSRVPGNEDVGSRTGRTLSYRKTWPTWLRRKRQLTIGACSSPVDV